MKFAVVIPNFNSAQLVRRCVAAMLEQKLAADQSLDVVVVDDGSTDGSADLIAAQFGDAVTLVRLGKNQGRSTARNRGAAATDAELLIFVDSDCVPPDKNFVAAHAAARRGGVQLGFGNITTPGPGFWNQIQRDAAKWRLAALQAGEIWTFTTQNVAIDHRLFDEVGGFEAIFNRHGFEDRDLFIRLARAGAVTRFVEDARVVHEDRITLASVARKMGEAGYMSAWEFADRHPEDYRRMHFNRLDCRARRWLIAVDKLIWPVANWASQQRETWLEQEWIPFRLRASAARAVYGASFLHGTATRMRESRQTGSSV